MKLVKIIFLFVVILTTVLMVQPAQAHSRRERFEKSYKHHPHHFHSKSSLGLHVTFLPREHITIEIGPFRYFYYDGIYYQKINRSYVVVSPPYGAVIRQLPTNCSRVRINGKMYFVDDANYYVMVPQGYQIVPSPNGNSHAMVSRLVENGGVFTVNIPNSFGGFTPVDLKQCQGGYIGPQGEFYSEFPKIEQLKVMYAK